MRIAPRSFAFTALLGLFAALPALSIDISAPTLALLPEALGTTRTLAGLTLSLFMVGFALGQLGGGSLSDGGRKALKAGADLCLPKPLDFESIESFLFPRGAISFAAA